MAMKSVNQALAGEALADHRFQDEAEIAFGQEAVDKAIATERFDEAMLAAAAALASVYRGNWLLNRIANDRGRVVGAHMMVDLHFAHGQQGFTVTQLREEARRYAVCSPNRMTALAALFRVGGFLAPVPAEDSRQRRIAPTQALMDLHRARMGGILSANILIHPDLAPVLPLLAEDGVVADIVHANLCLWRSGLRAIGNDPLLQQLVERDAAFTLLFLMMAGMKRGETYRVTDLARQFSISRTHTLLILRESVAVGCVERVDANGPFRGTPMLMRIMQPFFARVFLAQAAAARGALARHRAREGATPEAAQSR